MWLRWKGGKGQEGKTLKGGGIRKGNEDEVEGWKWKRTSSVTLRRGY